MNVKAKHRCAKYLAWACVKYCQMENTEEEGKGNIPSGIIKCLQPLDIELDLIGCVLLNHKTLISFSQDPPPLITL